MTIHRKTKSVNTLLKIMARSGEALSVVDLIDRLKNEMNKTTVYRILDRLENDGILHSFQGRDGLKWYAKCKGCSSSYHLNSHPHFQCQHCGKTKCLPIDVVIPKISKVKIESISLLITGFCEDCLIANQNI